MHLGALEMGEDDILEDFEHQTPGQECLLEFLAEDFCGFGQGTQPKQH